MILLGLSGSLRAASTNAALLRSLRLETPTGCRLDLYDRLGDLPIFNPDDEGNRTPAEASRLIEAVSRADGIVIACPEYAHGVPGGLKNALDWLVSGPAAVGKPAMLIHSSHRSQISREALREVLTTMSFRLVPGPELEITLLGRTAEESDLVLEGETARKNMRDCLSRFCQFIGQS